jgi:hypothetical protein
MRIVALVALAVAAMAIRRSLDLADFAIYSSRDPGPYDGSYPPLIEEETLQ